MIESHKICKVSLQLNYNVECLKYSTIISTKSFLSSHNEFKFYNMILYSKKEIFRVDNKSIILKKVKKDIFANLFRKSNKKPGEK